VVKILFNEIAPAQKDRPGGYTRIVRMHQRQGDASQLAILEWVDMPIVTETPVAEKPAEEAKPAETAEEGKAEKKGKKKKEKVETAEAKA
jgi:large subunit ribosomal protein L17